MCHLPSACWVVLTARIEDWLHGEVRRQQIEAVQNKRLPGARFSSPSPSVFARSDKSIFFWVLAIAYRALLSIGSICYVSSFSPIQNSSVLSLRTVNNCRDAEHLQSFLSTKPFHKTRIKDLNEDQDSVLSSETWLGDCLMRNYL